MTDKIKVKLKTDTSFHKLDDESSSGETWLVSYADLMTLIACFFILMMAFANYDPTTFSSKTKEVAEHFNKEKQQAQESKMNQLMSEIERHNDLQKFTSVSINNSELSINFNSNILFSSGEYELGANVLPVLDAMIDLIKSKDSMYRIIIEGHTDDRPLKNKFFKSNWALSGARAASVVDRFEMHGFPPENLRSVGLGPTQPIMPNKDENGDPIEENMKMNRRVVIKVIEPINKEARIKLGLGVYFED